MARLKLPLGLVFVRLVVLEVVNICMYVVHKHKYIILFIILLVYIGTSLHCTCSTSTS